MFWRWTESNVSEKMLEATINHPNPASTVVPKIVTFGVGASLNHVFPTPIFRSFRSAFGSPMLQVSGGNFDAALTTTVGGDSASETTGQN
jgi:hypothetical protein